MVPELKGEQLAKFLEWKTEFLSKNKPTFGISDNVLASSSKNQSTSVTEWNESNSPENFKLLKNESNLKAQSLNATTQHVPATPAKLALNTNYFNSVEVLYSISIQSKYSTYLSVTERDRMSIAWDFHDTNICKLM